MVEYNNFSLILWFWASTQFFIHRLAQQWTFLWIYKYCKHHYFTALLSCIRLHVTLAYMGARRNCLREWGANQSQKHKKTIIVWPILLVFRRSRLLLRISIASAQDTSSFEAFEQNVDQNVPPSFQQLLRVTTIHPGHPLRAPIRLVVLNPSLQSLSVICITRKPVCDWLLE